MGAFSHVETVSKTVLHSSAMFTRSIGLNDHVNHCSYGQLVARPCFCAQRYVDVMFSEHEQQIRSKQDKLH